MKPVDLRNENWASMMGRMEGLRKVVYGQLAKHGPCTTRRLAEVSGIDLLTVRPRVTELVSLGLVELIRAEGGQGVYMANHLEIAEAKFIEMQRAAQQGQMKLF